MEESVIERMVILAMMSYGGGMLGREVGEEASEVTEAAWLASNPTCVPH